MSIVHSDRLNKFGLPKHIVRSPRPVRGHSASLEVLLRARDDVQGLLMDAMAALKQGRISTRLYDIEHARIRAALSKAELQYELAEKRARRRR